MATIIVHSIGEHDMTRIEVVQTGSIVIAVETTRRVVGMSTMDRSAHQVNTMQTPIERKHKGILSRKPGTLSTVTIGLDATFIMVVIDELEKGTVNILMGRYGGVGLSNSIGCQPVVTIEHHDIVAVSHTKAFVASYSLSAVFGKANYMDTLVGGGIT